MYYEEKIIDGILCHRGTPDGKWIKFSAEDLTQMLNNWRGIKHHILSILNSIPADSYLYLTANNLSSIIFGLP